MEACKENKKRINNPYAFPKHDKLDALLWPEFYALVRPKAKRKPKPCLSCGVIHGHKKAGSEEFRTCSTCQVHNSSQSARFSMV